MNAVLGAGLSNPRVIDAAESSSAIVNTRTKSGVINPSKTSAGRNLKFLKENPIPLSDIASRTCETSSLTVGKNRIATAKVMTNARGIFIA